MNKKKINLILNYYSSIISCISISILDNSACKDSIFFCSKEKYWSIKIDFESSDNSSEFIVLRGFLEVVGGLDTVGVYSDKPIIIDNLNEGITWKNGSINRNEKKIDFWIGKRAQSGKKIPKRFKKNLKFHE